jgi:hypothetical protein
MLSSTLSLESAWPDKVTASLKREFTLPTFALGPISVNLSDVTVNIPDVGERTIEMEQVNAAVNKFLDAEVNNRLEMIVSEFSGRKVMIEASREIDLPDLSGELGQAENLLKVRYVVPTCFPDYVFPDPDDDPSVDPGVILDPDDDDGLPLSPGLSTPSTGIGSGDGGADGNAALAATLAGAGILTGVGVAGTAIRRKFMKQ